MVDHTPGVAGTDPHTGDALPETPAHRAARINVHRHAAAEQVADAERRLTLAIEFLEDCDCDDVQDALLAAQRALVPHRQELDR